MIQFQSTDYVVGQWFFEFNPAVTNGVKGAMIVMLFKRDIDGVPSWGMARRITTNKGEKADVDFFPMKDELVTEEKAFESVNSMNAEMATEQMEIFDYIDVRGNPMDYANKVRALPYMGVTELSLEDAMKLGAEGKLPPEIYEAVKKAHANQDKDAK